jgi:hypothetical protein
VCDESNDIEISDLPTVCDEAGLSDLPIVCDEAGLSDLPIVCDEAELSDLPTVCSNPDETSSPTLGPCCEVPTVRELCDIADAPVPPRVCIVDARRTRLDSIDDALGQTRNPENSLLAKVLHNFQPAYRNAF